MPTRLATIHAITIALACPAALAQPQDTPQPDNAQPAAQPAEPATPQPPPPPADLDSKLDLASPPWTFCIEPGAWFVGAGGRLRMPRNTPLGTPNDKVDIAGLNFDNPRFVPFAEINARKGNWRIALRGFYYDATRDSSGNSGQIGDVVFDPADTLRSSMTFASYELEGAYTVAGGQSNKLESGVYAITTRFDLIAGVRVYDVDWTITNTGSSAGPLVTSDDGIWVQPEIGAKLNMDLWRDITIDLQVTVGGIPVGSETSYSGDIIAGIMYNPTPHVGVQLGYRSLFFGVSKGDGEGEFGFNGAMQGLYGTLVFRF